jgi:ABC-2 type transport system ATP-binding protein
MNDLSSTGNLSALAGEPAISARGMVKTFGTLRAVDGIDLIVPRGMIFAILGPNGAGKTTLMRMLATLLKPDAGSATVMGHDLHQSPHDVRASIAMTGQFASLDEDLTGRENLMLLARLWGFRGRAARNRADELLAAFGLSDAATKQVKNYSGGMRRRLDIAASLIITPGVLFLDEPTTGLDPNARKDVWKMIRGRRGRPACRAHRRHRPRQEDRGGHQPRAEGRDRFRFPACRAFQSRPARRGSGAARGSARASRPAQRRGRRTFRSRRHGPGGQ